MAREIMTELSESGSNESLPPDSIEPTSIDSDSDTALLPYARGIAASEVSKAVFSRFLPTSLASLAAVLGVLGVLGSPPLLEVVGVILGSCALMSAGYWVGLSALQRWLFPDAEVTGRRSLVAGVFSPIGLITVVMLGGGAGMLEGLGLMFVSGIVMALLMFFAWLSPTPDRLLDEKYLPAGAASEPCLESQSV